MPDIEMPDHWAELTTKERALQIAARLCDRMKVKETGNNAGEWVEEFLGATGLGRGNPWCAAFVFWCLRRAGYPPPMPSHPARVSNWREWGIRFGRLTLNPGRGDLLFRVNPDGTGHIGFVVRRLGPVVQTIEGNTDGAGSREGDGLYRKVRRVAAWRFIRL